MMTKFNVGDKLRVINVDAIGYGKDYYYNGMETDVVSMFGGYPVLRGKDGTEAIVIVSSEYHAIERITDKPKKSARITALETEVSALRAKVEALEKANKPTTVVQNVTIDAESVKSIGDITKIFDTISHKYPLTARFDAETNAKADAILADIKRKATPRELTPNGQRADVIKRAKAFVAGGQARCGRKISYVVNAEKRTVVALKHRISFGCEGAVIGRGIAKCDPSDVFNADIGKAIALGRALGVDVTEFTKAVQPTEIVVGQRIFYTRNYPNLLVIANGLKPESQEISVRLATMHASSNRILEDTNAVYV